MTSEEVKYGSPSLVKNTIEQMIKRAIAKRVPTMTAIKNKLFGLPLSSKAIDLMIISFFRPQIMKIPSAKAKKVVRPIASTGKNLFSASPLMTAISENTIKMVESTNSEPLISL